MIEGKILSYGDNLSEVYAIRRKVFVEELGNSEKIEFDQFDADAMHVIVYEQDSKDKGKININYANKKIPVATGRIVYDGVKCKIDHIAVLKEYRNNQYGDFTVRMLLNKAFIAGINEVTVLALPNVIDFYKKIGFKLNEEKSRVNDTYYYEMTICMTDVITKCKK